MNKTKFICKDANEFKIMFKYIKHQYHIWSTIDFNHIEDILKNITKPILLYEQTYIGHCEDCCSACELCKDYDTVKTTSFLRKKKFKRILK